MLERRRVLEIRVIRGFSLLECAITMVIMVSIFMLCESMFIIQQKAGDAVTKEIEHVDIIRQLLLRLEPLVAQAGFLGIQSVANHFPLHMHGQIIGSRMPEQALSIYRATGKGWSPPLPSMLQGKVAPGTDVLILEMALPKRPLPVSGWLVIADGQKADIFWQEISQLHSIQQLYPAYAVTSMWHVVAFYVQPSQTGLSLMQKSLSPYQDAVNILEKLEGFRCAEEGELLKITVKYAGEEIGLWMGKQNAP